MALLDINLTHLTNLESKQALATKLGIDYTTISGATNDLWTAAEFQTFIQNGLLRAWDYKLWPFTKKAKVVTSTSDIASAGYMDHPTDQVLGSIYRLRAGGKRFAKLDFDDYLTALEDDSTTTEKIWAEWENYIFINANAYAVGDVIDLFGKKMAPALSADADLLPFSPATDNSEHSGNQAIVQLAYAEALSTGKSDASSAKAAAERLDAYRTLDNCWAPFAQQRANSQNMNRQMFNIPDMFGTRRSRGSSPIGNF